MSTSQEAGRSPDEMSFRSFFEALRELGPLRVISISGPSVFESICEVSTFAIREGWLNAITDSYHWHLRLDAIGSVTARDQIHERSGRRVLFFELREEPDGEPFLFIYLHRGKDEEFGDERELRFARLYSLLGNGKPLRSDP